MNEYIFNLEGIDLLQVIRTDGCVEIHELKKDKVSLKTNYNFYLLRDKLKFKNGKIMMITKEIKNV